MGERLICRKCHNGLYSYSEPDKEDWENRKMKCDVCGFEETLHEFGNDLKITLKKNIKITIYNFNSGITKTVNMNEVYKINRNKNHISIYYKTKNKNINIGVGYPKKRFKITIQ